MTGRARKRLTGYASLILPDGTKKQWGMAEGLPEAKKAIFLMPEPERLFYESGILESAAKAMQNASCPPGKYRFADLLRKN